MALQQGPTTFDSFLPENSKIDYRSRTLHPLHGFRGILTSTFPHRHQNQSMHRRFRNVASRDETRHTQISEHATRKLGKASTEHTGFYFRRTLPTRQPLPPSLFPTRLDFKSINANRTNPRPTFPIDIANFPTLLRPQTPTLHQIAPLHATHTHTHATPTGIPPVVRRSKESSPKEKKRGCRMGCFACILFFWRVGRSVGRSRQNQTKPPVNE